ncbi:unnamed protein product [Calypogeia fissa]
MAMRAVLRSAAAKSWRSRSVAAANANGCSQISRNCDSDGPSSPVVCSSASLAIPQIPLPKLFSPRFFSSRMGPSAHSVSTLLDSHCLSSSSSSSSSASKSVALRILSEVSSYSISASSVAPFSSYSAGLRRSLADLRLSNVSGLGEQKHGGASLALRTSMQQRRSLSKLKKYKMKSYSSYKERFKLMADGTYKRWRSGTRHNAHSKTAKQRRQLRRPSIAPAALATVMKKLNFVR